MEKSREYSNSKDLHKTSENTSKIPVITKMSQYQSDDLSRFRRLATEIIRPILELGDLAQLLKMGLLRCFTSLIVNVHFASLLKKTDEISTIFRNF